MFREFESIIDVLTTDEQDFVEHLTAIRWKDGAYCPHCGSTKVYHFSDKKTHKCGEKECRKRFSIRVGSIFEDSKLPLTKWYGAIWLLTTNKKGIASTTLAKHLKVTQKTAWFMLHRLRHAARTNSFNRKLEGTVEVDETFHGGKERNKHAHKKTPGSQGGKGKAVVWGALERDGELRVEHIDGTDGKTLKGKVTEHVADGATVMTDEAAAYKGLQGRVNHHAVNHSANEWVRHFCIHTNGIEGAWSHFKRQVIGVHHWLSDDHLHRYLSEFAWRWNRREMEDGERVNALLDSVSGKRLTYRALTA